ncbi:MAG: hypothetical protein AAF950_16095 [Pseudomonadota bacterium]
MQWHVVILVFAIAMIIFSVVVATLVEIIHHFERSRSLGLEKMLERLHDDVIQLYTGGIDACMLINRYSFIFEMTRIRGSVASNTSATTKAAMPETR